MSIIKDANYAKMNYKNSESTYENLTPTALANKVNYNQNDLYYAPYSSDIFRNNLESTNVVDAITEIENRVAQCGRKFDELEFGAGKDIDLLDGAGNQITLDKYYIGNIVYLPMTQKYYMLLYSFTYSRSVLLQSNDNLSWNINSESTDIICIDMKCNSRYLCFIGYETNYYGGYMRKLFFAGSSGDAFNDRRTISNLGIMQSTPSNQHDLGQYFCTSFDMDDNSILCLSLNKDINFDAMYAFRIDCDGRIDNILHSIVYETSGFPKILNINPGQYIYYMKGSEFQPQLISLTTENLVKREFFPSSNIYDILLIDEFAYSSYNNSLFARTDNVSGLNSKLKYINISSPADIRIRPYNSFAPKILLAKRCCDNYIFYTDAFRGQSVNRKWAYLNSYFYGLNFKNNTTVSLNDGNGNDIGSNYIITTGFNPSFINKLNNYLFIYTNNEVNSTTLNNSKLYISQIKI